MRTYMHQNIQHATRTWTALTLEILATAAIYVILSMAGVAQGITVLASFIAALAFVLSGVFLTYKVLPQTNASSARIVGESARDMQTAIPSQVSPGDEDGPKARIYQLADEFIGSHMEEQLGTFQALWEQLKQRSLEALEKLSGQLPTGSAGLGFTESNQLRAVISVITWAITHQSSLSKMTPPSAIRTITKEAESRGCPQGLSRALARFLQARLGGRK